ncbi:MAG: PDGLE domain-containing protein [Candidatus Nanopelagicales bacterium]
MTSASSRRGLWIVVGAGLVISLFLAGIVSFYASSSPDGLEKVAEDVGFIDAAQDSAVAGSPLSDYGVAGVSDERLSVGLAGVVGLIATGVLAFGLFVWLGRRNRNAAAEPTADAVPASGG